MLAKSGRFPLHSAHDLCDDADGIRNFIRQAQVTSLVIAGVCGPISLARVGRCAEAAGVPLFAVQTLCLDVYGRAQDGSIGEAGALAISVNANKAAAASFAHLAKTAQQRGCTNKHHVLSHFIRTWTAAESTIRGRQLHHFGRCDLDGDVHWESSVLHWGLEDLPRHQVAEQRVGGPEPDVLARSALRSILHEPVCTFFLSIEETNLRKGSGQVFFNIDIMHLLTSNPRSIVDPAGTEER